MYTNDEIEHLKQQAFSTLSSVNTFLSNKNKDLKNAIFNEATQDLSAYDALSSKWDDPRYSRDIDE